MKSKDKVKIGLALTLCLCALLVIEYFFNIVFDIFIFGISFLCVLEFKKLQLKSGMPTFDYCPEIACFLVFVAAFSGVLCGLSATVILLIEIVFVIVFYLVIFVGSFLIFSKDLEDDIFRNATNMSIKRFAFFKANNTLTCILYPTMLLFFMYFINHLSALGLNGITALGFSHIGLFGLILLFSICCLTDTFAMLFGLLIGGKKLFPKVSPKKTISGSLFGLLGGIVGALATYFIFSAIVPTYFSNVYFWQFIIIGLIGSIVAQAGDLFESYAKRRADVKDSGDLFRSHGGVLDRFDSIIFGCPYIFVCLLFLFA